MSKTRITAAIERKVRAAAGNRCEVCGFREKKGVKGHPWEVLELHHLQPEEKGGSTAAENLLLACPTCHALVQPFADRGAEAWLREFQIAYGRKIRRAR